MLLIAIPHSATTVLQTFQYFMIGNDRAFSIIHPFVISLVALSLCCLIYLFYLTFWFVYKLEDEILQRRLKVFSLVAIPFTVVFCWRLLLPILPISNPYWVNLLGCNFLTAYFSLHAIVIFGFAVLPVKYLMIGREDRNREELQKTAFKEKQVYLHTLYR